MVAINVAKVFSRTFNLKNWLGILVVNVYGNWNGSVGEDTAAGNGGAGSAPAPVHASDAAKALVSNSKSTSIGAGGTHTTGNGTTAGSNGANVERSATTADVALNAPTKLVQAAAKSPKVMTAVAAGSTGVLLILAAVMLMLAAGAFSLERKIK
jgi:hypothetical protein